MGGAAGHLQNIWEATDLTFGEIKDLTKKAMSGKLDATEKLDGQNLMLTWKNNQILIARTGKHLRNFGQDYGIKLNNIWTFFSPSTPDTVRSAYQKAGEDFQKIFSLNPAASQLIFEEGKYWLNAEILYQDTENVIHYGLNIIKIHNLFEVDLEGKKVFIDKTSKYMLLINMCFGVNNNFLIEDTNDVFIEASPYSLILINDNLKALQNKHNLKDFNTLEDYIYWEFCNYVQTFIDINGNREIYLSFAYRWGRQDKSISITKLLKGVDSDVANHLRTLDKNIKQQYKKIIEPLVYYFSILGMEILKNTRRITVKDVEKSVQVIKDKTDAALNSVKKYLKKETDLNLQRNLDLFYKLAAKTHIVPIEGVVFTYKDKLLKLNGLFTVLIQLIGHSKYTK